MSTPSRAGRSAPRTERSADAVDGDRALVEAELVVAGDGDAGLPMIMAEDSVSRSVAGPAPGAYQAWERRERPDRAVADGGARVEHADQERVDEDSADGDAPWCTRHRCLRCQSSWDHATGGDQCPRCGGPSQCRVGVGPCR